MTGTLFKKTCQMGSDGHDEKAWSECVLLLRRDTVVKPYFHKKNHLKTAKISDIKQRTWDLAIQRTNLLNDSSELPDGPARRSLRSNVKEKNKDIDRRQLSRHSGSRWFPHSQHLGVKSSCVSSSHFLVRHFWTLSSMDDHIVAYQ